MAEQWLDVAGYDDIYQVSDQGQVRNFAKCDAEDRLWYQFS
jgi:hypothetical protein